MSVPSLKTPRLTLRPLCAADASFILQLLNEPSFLEHIGDKHVRSIADAQAYIANGPVASYALHNFGLLLVAQNSTSEPIGVCGLLRRDTLPHPDMGFAYQPAFWGQGFAFEAAAAVLADARERLRLSVILGMTSPGNVASQQLLMKLGLRFDRVTYLDHDDRGTHLFSLAL